MVALHVSGSTVSEVFGFVYLTLFVSRLLFYRGFPKIMLGDIELEPATEANIGNVIDMLNLQNGGRCLSYSNAHFGHPQNLMKPGRATSMNSGWETGLYLFVILNLVFYKKKIKQFKQCESSLLTVVSSLFQIRYILKTNLCLCILLWSLLFFVQFSDNFIMCTIHPPLATILPNR